MTCLIDQAKIQGSQHEEKKKDDDQEKKNIYTYGYVKSTAIGVHLLHTACLTAQVWMSLWFQSTQIKGFIPLEHCVPNKDSWI